MNFRSGRIKRPVCNGHGHPAAIPVPDVRSLEIAGGLLRSRLDDLVINISHTAPVCFM